MADLIAFLLGNFTLTFLIIGLIASAVTLLGTPRPWTRQQVAEALLSYFLLFTVGFSYFYNFIFHVFLGELAAKLIGWADSPFQAEVGYASLGFSLIGFLAFRGGCEMRLAAVLGTAAFLWGAAVGHIRDILATGNFAPGNAGVILWSDILFPVIGFALLWLRYGRSAKAVSSRQV